MRNALGLGFDSRQVHVNREEEARWIQDFHPTQRAAVVRWLKEERDRKKMVDDIASAVVRKLTEEQRKDVDEMAGNFGRTLGSNKPPKEKK